MNFAEKNIWIIGASSGIGAALARELSKQGANLALSARREDELNSLNNKLGGSHHVYPLDVTDVKALQKAASDLSAIWPRIDSVIFLAAIYTPSQLEKLDIQDAHKTVNVNLNGAFNVVHSILPSMIAQKSGQIALCASVAGYRGLPNGQPYSATKAAVLNLAQSLRTEQAKNGLDIKVISPGFVKTPMTDKNDFDMPMVITPDQAAKAIAKGLQSKSFEIHFPKKFTFIMKIVRLLPAWLYFPIFNQK